MKKLLLLSLSLAIGSAAIAQPSDRFTGALLWKISGHGLENPSYILGTHHFSDEAAFDAIPGARAALEGAGQVVGELVMADQAAMATQIQLAALMPEGSSWRELLSAGDYELLDNTLKEKLGAGMEQMAMFKPGMLSLILGAMLFTEAYPDFNPQTHVAMDIVVQNFATDKGLPLVGLETVEDQIAAIFESEPLKIQAETLVCSIRNRDYGVEALKKLTDRYNAGDLAAIYADSFLDPNNPCPASDEAKQALVNGRNDKWLEKLPGIMAEAPSFIAVGALHLAGEEGLLFRLDKAGYTVEAVK